MSNSIEERITEILRNLALAYGGESQVGISDLGRAIAGHVNNNGLRGTTEELAATAAILLIEAWGDDSDYLPVSVEIAHAIEAARYSDKPSRPSKFSY